MTKHVYVVHYYDEHISESQIDNIFSNKKLATHYINLKPEDKRGLYGFEKWVLIDKKFAKQHLQYERED